MMTHQKKQLPQSTAPVSYAGTVSLALAMVLLGACTEANPDDELPAAAELEPEDEPTPLTDDEVEAIRDAHVVASLPVDGLGTVEIITDGMEAPSFSYILLGPKGLMDVIGQLEDQGATAAEVFVTLSGNGSVVPDVLMADHREKARVGEVEGEQPRELAFTTFRTLAQDSNYCTGSFSTFVDDWEDDFAAYWMCRSTANPATGNHSYSVPASSNGRALTACDSDTDGSPMFVTYQQYMSLGGPAQWVPIWAGFVSDDDAVHLYSGGAGFNTLMTINHGYGPVYVAYGYAPGCIP